MNEYEGMSRARRFISRSAFVGALIFGGAAGAFCALAIGDSPSSDTEMSSPALTPTEIADIQKTSEDLDHRRNQEVTKATLCTVASLGFGATRVVVARNMS